MQSLSNHLDSSRMRLSRSRSISSGMESGHGFPPLNTQMPCFFLSPGRERTRFLPPVFFMQAVYYSTDSDRNIRWNRGPTN